MKDTFREQLVTTLPILASLYTEILHMFSNLPQKRLDLAKLCVLPNFYSNLPIFLHGYISHLYSVLILNRELYSELLNAAEQVEWLHSWNRSVVNGDCEMHKSLYFPVIAVLFCKAWRIVYQMRVVGEFEHLVINGLKMAQNQGGRSWRPFGERKIIPQSFRRARIYKFSRQKHRFLQNCNFAWILVVFGLIMLVML